MDRGGRLTVSARALPRARSPLWLGVIWLFCRRWLAGDQREGLKGDGSEALLQVPAQGHQLGLEGAQAFQGVAAGGENALRDATRLIAQGPALFSQLDDDHAFVLL